MPRSTEPGSGFRLIAAVVFGIGLAVTGGVAFWIINQSHQVNGVGLLRRQDWPVNDPWMWALAGFVLGAVGRGIADVRRASHARKARDVAAEQGREFTEEPELPPGADGLPLLAGWSDGRNAMTGTENGVPVFLLDCTTVVRGGESDSYTNRTVAVLPAADLPAFDLRPRGVGRRLLSWAGIEGITFDPASAGPADADTVARFTGQFHLTASDAFVMLQALKDGKSPEQAAREEAVRRLFTPAVMEVVTAYPEYAVQAANGFVAVWKGSGTLPARKRPELWDAAVALHGVLTRPPGRTAPAVPARTGTDPDRQARKMQQTLIGAVIGGFCGFVVSAMVISVLFFGREPGQPRGPGFCLEPVAFLGCIGLGALLGARIGSWLPVRVRPPGPPEDPVQKQRREKRVGCAALGGFFAGFFGGFVAFAVSKIALDWKLANFGMEGAVFFGSIFGGAILGAVGCGMLMHRLTRPKPPTGGGNLMPGEPGA